MTAGITRVAAFIGIGIFSALAVAAVKAGGAVRLPADPVGARRTARRAIALARILACPRHRLPAARRDANRSLPQARHVGACLPGAAAIRRPGGACQSGHRDDRVLLCAHRGARPDSAPRPFDGAVDPRGHRLADSLGIAALCPLRRFGAGIDACADRSPRRPGSRGARPPRRLCHRNDPGPLRSGRLSGDRRATTGVHGRGARLSEDPPRAVARPILADCSARNRDRARRAGGSGGRGWAGR